MIRPAARLVLLAAAALTLSACATFTDDNIAARVGDAELSYSDFERRVRLVSDEAGDTIDAESGRAVISNWIALELSRESGLVDRYADGPEASGVLCVSAANVADGAAAQAAVADLRNGGDWAAFVADAQPAAALAGRQECLPTEVIGELVIQIAGMSTDNPYQVVVFPDNTVAVLRMQPVSEVNGFELLRVRQTIDAPTVDAIVASAVDADVYIDPRFGIFDAERFGVAALG